MNLSFTDAKLRQGRNKKISCLYNGSLTSTERRYQRFFFYKRQSLKARIHKTKSICGELNVRLYSHQQMNTHFLTFKRLALRTMAGDALKDEVNDATSIFRGFLMVFCMRVGLHNV